LSGDSRRVFVAGIVRGDDDAARAT
jgi:hypothetical protein